MARAWVVAVWLAAVAAAVVAQEDSTLVRRYRRTTEFVGECTVARLNDLGSSKVMDLDFHSQNDRGNQYFIVRGDGNLIRRGLYESTCPVRNVGEYDNGWLYVSSEPCDCASPGEDVCTLSLQVANEGGAGDPFSYFELEEATWSRQLRDLDGPISGRAVLADSGGDAPTSGCSALTNDVSGKIVMVDRGLCSFQTKFDNAVAAGASALIVVNGEGSQLTGMSARSSIPGFMISFEDGQVLKTQSPKISFGPGVGQVDESDEEQEPAGLLHVPWREIDDDTDVISWVNTLRYAKGDVYLDPRNYLWVVGPDGEQTVKVYDLRPGISTPTELASDISFNHFVELNSWRFFQREGRTFLVAAEFGVDRLQIRDVTNLLDITIIDQIDVPGCQQLEFASPGSDYLYVESNVFGQEAPTLLVVHIDFEYVLNVVNELTLDLDTDQGIVSFIKVNENVLYVGLGSFGVSAYEISDERNPRFLVTKRTYDGVQELSYTVGALSACVVPDHPELVYVGNLDENSRSELVGYKLTIAPVVVPTVVEETSFTPSVAVTVPAVEGITPDTEYQSSNYVGLSGDTVSASDIGGDQTSSEDEYDSDEDDDDDDGGRVIIINIFNTPASHVRSPQPPPPPPAPVPGLPVPTSFTFSAAAVLAPALAGVLGLVVLAL